MKTTLRILSLSVILVLFSLTAISQRHQGAGQHMEKFRSMKIAYFTDNLDLTAKEAETFWPIYYDFEKKKSELMKGRQMKSREFVEKADELSDQEVEEIVDQQFEIRKKELQLDIEFKNELKKILPSKKVMNFYITEVKFREYMLRRIREERGDSNRKGKQQLP